MKTRSQRRERSHRLDSTTVTTTWARLDVLSLLCDGAAQFATPQSYYARPANTTATAACGFLHLPLPVWTIQLSWAGVRRLPFRRGAPTPRKTRRPCPRLPRL